jgi:hypothetical protein
VRRKAGSLVPLELAICSTALALRERGVEQFHGYLIAKELKDAQMRSCSPPTARCIAPSAGSSRWGS